MKSIEKSLIIALGVLLVSGAAYAAKPMKVFVLAGQSNMQGKAAVSTFWRIGATPDSAPMMKDILGADGQPVVLDDVYITYLSAMKTTPVERQGKLTAGFGSSTNQIGPEFTFGVYMHKMLNEPMLLIKIAWGGKSLNVDFRPPSAGPYEFTTEAQKAYDDARKAAMREASGHYYGLMMEHVKKVLADPGKYHPAYDKEAGYEIAGFVWFQGWNDWCNGHAYPESQEEPGRRFELYSTLLAQFIRDVRKDLNTPNMPFIIGVMGCDGPKKPDDQMQYFRNAMAAPAEMPEFKGNVAAVLTEKCWDMEREALVDRIWQASKEQVEKKYEGQKKPNPRALDNEARGYQEELKGKLLTAEEKRFYDEGATKGGGYHYNGSAYTMTKIGKSFAEAMKELIDEKK